MVAPTGNEEQVRYDILIEAKQAIQDLRTIGLVAADNAKKIQIFTDVVLATSKKWGITWRQDLEIFKQINAELSKSKKGTLFGNTGGQNLFDAVGKNISALEQSGRLQQRSFEGRRKNKQNFSRRFLATQEKILSKS